MDLLIENDGMQFGDVVKQNQKIILLAEKGELKNNPLSGVGIASFLDDDDISELLREVRTNLRRAGQTVTKCMFDNGNLIIEAKYR
jgi:uncharacterized protein YjgD (DUF1641 family)